ncbi:hypothetical protein [Atlantibacter hermannii]|uniref:hypothetical protein n=1 Tax=Atlantibacter hermannii TaxID=565 RepID=UPI00289CAC91|nr:hypothetical protein [Atlantibacter hermannii]
MTSKEKMQRLEALESAGVTNDDAAWRGMCARYGFPVIPLNEATREQRNAVMDAYLDEEFY